jgi:hypothetical protein
VVAGVKSILFGEDETVMPMAGEAVQLSPQEYESPLQL